MPRPNVLAGHELPGEGRTHVDWEGWRSGPGRTRCSCGEPSPDLQSTNARKRWHREHKDQVRAAQAAAGTATQVGDGCKASPSGLCLNMTDGHARCDEGECLVPPDQQPTGNARQPSGGDV